MAEFPEGFASYLSRADRILRSPRLVSGLVQQAAKTMVAEGSVAGALSRVRAELRTSLALIRAWLSGRYTGVSYGSIMLLVAGLAYLVTPVDALPDVIPGVGLIDDLTVLSVVFAQLQQELEAFQRWLETPAPAAL